MDMTAGRKPDAPKPAPELKVVAKKPAKPKPAEPALEGKDTIVPAPAPKIPGPIPRPPAPPVVDKRIEAAIRKSKAAKRRLITVSFALMVALPTLIGAMYFLLIASDQYAAEARFSVRGSEQTSTDVLGMLSGGASSSANTGDSYIVQDYIGSRELVDRLEARIGLRAKFDTPAADWWARFPASEPVEEFLPYWQDMTTVNYDHYSGIISLEVRAFSPEDARQIAAAIVDESRGLVNRLSEQSRLDTVAFAQREVQFAEERLREARAAVTRFRNAENTVNPAAIAQAHEALIAELDGQLNKAEADLRGLEGLVGPEAPSRRILENRIAAIKSQIAERRTRVGTGETAVDGTSQGISAQLAAFQDLETETEFAQKAYLSSLASLESARAEAKREQRYLATFVSPSIPQDATYPLRYLNTLLVLVGSLVLWGISALLYAAVKDHMV